MNRRSLLPALLVVSFLAIPSVKAKESPTATEVVAPADALKAYVAASDSSYQWTKRRSEKFGQGTLTELILTSQTWKDTVWKHQLFIYRPSHVASSKNMLLLINGGSWRDELAKAVAAGGEGFPKEALVIAQVAEALHTPIAIVSQVPQQPLFDGKREDALISYTFAKFYETADVDWPLLLPMAKSAVRAMDAIEEFAAQEWNEQVEHFLVTGASKRGWTTWLTAAVDPRVNALAPMVINMLNMEPHMQLQKTSFGGYSDEITDYTERGLQNLLGTERGRALRTIVDPYSYRREIGQPKLIILGTNDRYWPVDSLNLYWDGLEGERYIEYVPNNGHDIQDYPRVLGTVAALHRSVSGGKPMPLLDWKFAEHDGGVELNLSTDAEPLEVLAWTATAPTRDFREAVWRSQRVEPRADNSYQVKQPQPSNGFAAVYAEARYAGEPLPFYLSTGLRVISAPESLSTVGGP